MAKDPDPIAIRLVALDGHRIPLKGKERVEAIKLMCKQDLKPQVMADRLRISIDTLQRFANRSSLELPPAIEPEHWAVKYMDRFKTNPNRKKRRKS